MICFITFKEGGRYIPLEIPDYKGPKDTVSRIKKITKTFFIVFLEGKLYDAVLHSLQSRKNNRYNYHSGWQKDDIELYNYLYSEYHRIRYLANEGCRIDSVIGTKITLSDILKLKDVRKNNALYKEQGTITPCL